MQRLGLESGTAQRVAAEIAALQRRDLDRPAAAGIGVVPSGATPWS
jgi:hypothetical protein